MQNRSNVKRVTTVRNSPFFLSPPNAPGRTHRTSGPRKPSGAASAFNRLGEPIADTLHKGDHVLVDGLLVGSTYERENGKSKKAKAAKVTVFWSVRANSIRRLSRAETEVPTAATSAEAGAEPGVAPF